MGITIDMPTARLIAHAARRVSRDSAFAPLDTKATIPHMSNQAEADRKVIRSTDDDLQISMDAAKDEVELKALMPTGS